MANNEFGRGDCGENEARILSAFFASKNLTGAGYLTSRAKKIFNLLQYAFTQAPIF